MDRKMRVFWISLILSTLGNLNYGSRLFIPVLLGGPGGGQLNDLFRFALSSLWYVITLAAIYLGYRVGREADLNNEYQGFVKALGAGWLASSLIFVPLYLFTGEVWRQIAEFTAFYGFTGGYEVGAVLFSSITLGWVTRDGFQFKREWNPVILKPVLVYNGTLLLRSWLQRVISFIGINSSNRGAISWQMSVLSWSTLPIWLWYLVRMLSSGRKIDLETDHGSVLYTVLVPSLAYATLSHLGIILFYYLRAPGWWILFNLPVAYGSRFVSSMLGVLGLPFGLLCYGYLNSRYSYNAQLSESSDSSLNEG